MIRYSQCWEDTNVVNKALQFTKDDTVLIISSGGCNALNIASQEVEKLYAVDSNYLQNCLLKLKCLAIENLDYKEVLAFLGYRECEERLKTYATIAYQLNYSEKQYWDNNKDLIQMGVANCGKFENYLRFFSKKILPFVHSKKEIKKLLKPKTNIEQQKYYDNKWNSFRWRMMFKIFFSRLVMSGRGRAKEMFSENTNSSVGSMFFDRAGDTLKYKKLDTNFYLNYILLSKENKLLPDYLKKQNYSFKNMNNLEIVNSGLFSFLQSSEENSISKYDLSDVFEPLDIDTTNKIFEEIKRTAKNGARLLFWNNLVKRDVPEYLKKYFVRDFKLEEELKKVDKIFFYDKFLIYTINK